ncbi:MAG TPA: oxidoreductase [Mycobacteriales bacterium]|nr:oxidoreductase [Mycobacteriales bacterium]
MTQADAAGTWKLGGDLEVPRMGFGAMQLGGRNAFGRADDPEQSRRALRTAIELGVRHIDTSDYYGPHLVNELIRDTLRPYPEDLVLVTKIGGRRDAAGRWLPALSPDEIRAGVHDNLTHLGVDRLDVVNLRVMTTGEPIGEKLAVLAALREQGLIRHLGVSNADAAQLAEAQRIASVVCMQNMYSVADRSDDPLVAECAEQGIAYVPFFPLGSAFQPFEAAGLETVAKRHEVSIHRVALAWLLQRSRNVLVIPGSGDPAHVAENVAAASLALTDEDLAELNRS